jgi:seryl-tRNA synthetase
MNKLSKIAPLIVILACAGSLFFAFKLGGIKKELNDKVVTLTSDKDRLEKDLTGAKQDLASTKQTLQATQGELATANANLQARQVELTAKTQEAEQLKAQVTEKDKALQQAKTESAAAQDALKKIQDSLQAAGIQDVGNIEQLRDKIVAQSDENKVLGQQLVVMREETLRLKGKIEELTVTPVNVRGHVAAVHERWGFVVLDLGRSQRVRPSAQFLVYRDRKLVGKVQVVSVGQTTSIAELLPEYQHGTPRVGDLVVR